MSGKETNWNNQGGPMGEGGVGDSDEGSEIGKG